MLLAAMLISRAFRRVAHPNVVLFDVRVGPLTLSGLGHAFDSG